MIEIALRRWMYKKVSMTEKGSIHIGPFFGNGNPSLILFFPFVYCSGKNHLLRYYKPFIGRASCAGRTRLFLKPFTIAKKTAMFDCCKICLLLIGLCLFNPVAMAQEQFVQEATRAAQDGVDHFLDAQVGGFTVAELILCFSIVLLTVFLRNVLTRVIFARLKRLASKTQIEYDDRVLQTLEKPVSLMFLLVGVYLAVGVLSLGAEMRQFFTQLFHGVSVILFFWALLRLIDVIADILIDVTKKKGNSIFAFIPLIHKATRVFVGIVAIITILDNFGISVGGLLATLGIGGAAFAFAAKDTLANLYGSLALALDRPFKVGDWIQVGGKVDGDVEEIGLRSTKVRTWPKTIISIPNSVLANEYIDNWSRMPKRRVKQVVGVTYNSGPDEMTGLVEDMRQLLRDDEGVDQSFILVNFMDFGESSLNILVYYFTKSTAWLEHMDVRQRVNVKIMKAIKARGLAMAFPSRTVYFDGDVAKAMASASAGDPMPGDSGPSTPL